VDGPQSGARSEAELEVLLDAVNDACASVRRLACQACCRAALAHPDWFEPRHYTKLLTLLSDEDPEVRVTAMGAFQALAGFRTGKVAAVIGDISSRLHDGDEGAGVDDRGGRDLEAALGITMDRLVGDVEQLEREVRALEGRRRELLQYMETEAVRVGEEIHHEVLNSLTGYLATAIDEEDYRDAKVGLDNLIAELRRIMNNLYPRDLETQGFLQTIRNRLRDAERLLVRRRPESRTQFACAAEVSDDAVAACMGEPSHLVLLYRIVLEAIGNARKHARGTLITVSIRAPEPGAIEISVADNGSGRGGPFGESTGMTLMRRRAEEIGADIAYGPAEGDGTAVVVRLGCAGADRKDRVRAEPLPGPPGGGR